MRDVNYILKAGEIIIVDEFTGRTMQGRRWSDGLHQVRPAAAVDCSFPLTHCARLLFEQLVIATVESARHSFHSPPPPQAVEAKEGLEIQAESITLASVSYQAFFR